MWIISCVICLHGIESITAVIFQEYAECSQLHICSPDSFGLLLGTQLNLIFLPMHTGMAKKTNSCQQNVIGSQVCDSGCDFSLSSCFLLVRWMVPGKP